MVGLALFVNLFVFFSPSLPQVGVSYYAIQNPNFPCREALHVFHHVDYPATAVVWGGFGSDEKCLNKFLTLGKRRLLEIHISNEVCRRNSRCGPGELLRGYSVAKLNRALEKRESRVVTAYQHRVRAIRSYLEQHADENTEIILSTGLEDNYTQKSFSAVLEILRQEVGYAIARTSNKNGIKSDADYAEYHWVYSPLSKPCIWSGDGRDFSGDLRRSKHSNTMSVRDTYKFMPSLSQCHGVFFWQAAPQGIGSNGKFEYPLKRHYTVSPSDIRILNRLLIRFSQ